MNMWRIPCDIKKQKQLHMKQYLFSITLSLLVSSFSFAEDKGIVFNHSDFKTILAQAKKENKLVIIDAYTSWCGPCKWMAANIFTNDTVGQFYNTNFICAKFDMEKDEGLTIAKTYSVSVFPTFLFLDGDGKMVHRAVGGAPSQEFIGFGKNALDPSTQLSALMKRYENGERKSDFISTYVRMLAYANMHHEYEVALQEYFKTQPETELISAENWQMIVDMVYDHNSPQFNYVLNNKQLFASKYTEEKVNEKIRSVYTSSLRKYIAKKDDLGYHHLRSIIEKSNDSNSESVLFNADLSYYAMKKDWADYSKQAVLYTDKYYSTNSGMLNQIAWNFYENVADKNLLAKAEGWAKKSIEIKDGYANHDTYAAVLYKLGKHKDAKQAAEDAIALAKKDGEDFKETQALLDKINAQLSSGGSH